MFAEHVGWVFSMLFMSLHGASSKRCVGATNAKHKREPAGAAHRDSNTMASLLLETLFQMELLPFTVNVAGCGLSLFTRLV